MSRITLASDLKTRNGVPEGKDARITNSYVETKGDQSVVRKRPAAQGGIAVGTGTAQGGIGFMIGSTPYFIGFWADTMQTYTGSGTSWNSGTAYLMGAHTTFDFEDYWALADNIGNNPSSSPLYWTNTYTAQKPRYSLTPSGANISISMSTVTTYPDARTTIITKTYTTYIYGTSTIIDSGVGTNITRSAIGSTTAPEYSFDNFIALGGYSGYDYSKTSGELSYSWNGFAWIVLGSTIYASPY